MFLHAIARVWRNEQPAAQMGQIRFHKQCLTLAHATAGEVAQRAVYQLFNIGNGFVVSGWTDTDLYPVFGKGLQHFLRRDENFPAVVENGEAVARLGAFHHRLGAFLLGLHLRFQPFQLRKGLMVEHA